MSFWKRWFCSHEWEIQISTIAKPTRLKKFSISGLSEEEFAELTQGVTRVLLTCSECGSIEERKILGVPEGNLDVTTT